MQVTHRVTGPVGGKKRSAAIHVCEIPHLPPTQRHPTEASIPGRRRNPLPAPQTSPIRAPYLPSIAEDAATSAHSSANKSTAMADELDSLRGRSPNSQDARARVKKNPSVVSAVLQQAARAVSHISSRSKQCVTIGTGGRTERRGSSGARKGWGG